MGREAGLTPRFWAPRWGCPLLGEEMGWTLGMRVLGRCRAPRRGLLAVSWLPGSHSCRSGKALAPLDFGRGPQPGTGPHPLPRAPRARRGSARGAVGGAGDGIWASELTAFPGWWRVNSRCLGVPCADTCLPGGAASSSRAFAGCLCRLLQAGAALHQSEPVARWHEQSPLPASRGKGCRPGRPPGSPWPPPHPLPHTPLPALQPPTSRHSSLT